MLNVTIIPAVTFLLIIIGKTTLNYATITSYKITVRRRNGIVDMKFKYFSKKIALLSKAETT